MKKIIIGLGIIILLIALGNVKYTELNNIGIIDTIGITKEENDYKVYVKVLIPQKNDENNYEIYDFNLKSMNYLMNELYKKENKDILLSHLNLLILDNDLTKKEYKEIFNFFLNQDSRSNNFNVVSLQNFNSKILNESSLDINNLLNNNYQNTAEIYPATFNETIRDILENDISYLPIISYKDQSEVEGMKIIYNKNYNLNLKEATIINILKNRVQNINTTIDDKQIKVVKLNTFIETNKNKVTITITSTVNAKENIKEIFENYYRDEILKFLKEKDNSYILSLIKKENYNYFKNNKVVNIDYEINFNTHENTSSIIKGSDYLEK